MEVIQVSKGVGVALWTTKRLSTSLATCIFLLIVNHKFHMYNYGILNNSSFQQSKLELRNSSFIKRESYRGENSLFHMNYLRNIVYTTSHECSYLENHAHLQAKHT